MTILCLFAIGFCTWLIVFLRSYALDARHTIWLSGLVFADEAVGIGTGVWLARNGGIWEIVAVAAGGTLAATLAVRLFRRRDVSSGK